LKTQVKFSAIVAVGALLLAGCADSTYPSRDINVVVPFDAGGSTDLTARILSEPMGEDLDTEVVVTNTPGAGGGVGAQSVLNAKHDGYTILDDGMLSFAAMPVMDNLDTMPDDWDFWLATFTPNVVAVAADSPYQTLEDLVDAMEENPGEVTFGSAGPGSAGHVGAELVASGAGTEYEHVPYEGGNPAIVAALAGEVDAVAQLYVEMKDMLIAGDLRALATFADEDLIIDDDLVVPSIADFLPELATSLPLGETTGLAIPKGLDEDILKSIDGAYETAMKDPDFLDFCEEQGFTPVEVGRDGGMDYVKNLQSVVAWTLEDAGVAVNSPADLEVPEP